MRGQRILDLVRDIRDRGGTIICCPVRRSEMLETEQVANCSRCPWKSAPAMESTAKRMAVVHVILDHPEEYTEVTGKTPPSVDEIDEFEYWLFTETGA